MWNKPCLQTRGRSVLRPYNPFQSLRRGEPVARPPTKTSRESPKPLRYLLDALWILALMAYAFIGYPIAPFHGDEGINTAQSLDFYVRYLERDFERLAYSEEPANPIEQSYRMNDSPLIRYLIGFAGWRAGFTLDDLNAPWWFEQSYQWNVENGFYPGDDLLLASRVPSALLLAGGIGLVFVLGMLIGGRPVAYLGSLYLAVNPVMLLNGRRAMHEGIQLFFQVAILLLAIGLLHLLMGRIQGRPLAAGWEVLAAVLLGVAAGFGIAGKHTNVLAFGAAGLALAAWTLIAGRRVLLRAVLLGGLVLIVAAAAFLYWNPPLWDAPLARTWQVAAGRAEVLAGQVASFENSYQGDFRRQLAGLWRLVMAGPVMYYEDPAWAGYIGGQIALYEASWLSGLRVPYLNAALLPLVLAGVVALFRWGRVPAAARWIVGAWAAAVTVLALFGVPLGWQRYYLPLLPVYGLLAALGLHWLLIWQNFNRS